MPAVYLDTSAVGRVLLGEPDAGAILAALGAFDQRVASRLMATGDDFVGPVNVGNPGEFTILELAKAVIELTGSSSTVIFKPLPSDDPTQRCPNISLAKEKFGWEPKIKLKEGLVQAIAYFEQQFKGGLQK